MNLVYVVILTLASCIANVLPMALKGPALTRYDPCGLSVIHFDKISEQLWQGNVHLGLYNLTEVELKLSFEKQVQIYGASHNTSFSVSNDWHDFILKPKGTLPSNYAFFLFIGHVLPHENNVPILTRFTLNNMTLCNEEIKASQTIESLNVSKWNDEHYQHICGRRSLPHTELVSVRTESKAGDWPWHVAIFIKNIKTYAPKYECGGNVISRTAIVTAGHCVRKRGVLLEAHRIVVVAGVNKLSDNNQVGKQVLDAQQIILHPSYNDEYSTSDLAVIKVNKLKFTEYVQPICIWGPVYDKSKLYGQQATVVGFGRTEENKLSDVLRSTYTVVQNDTTCINYSPDLYTPLLNEFTFCVGTGPSSGINPRNGDSGGGLVVATMQPDHKVSWFLRGILSKCGVSPGHTECDPSFYVIYTDVGPHYGWLYHHSGLQFRNNIM